MNHLPAQTTSRPRLLLVEDDESLAGVLARVLSRSMDVSAARDVPEALALLGELAFDAVLLEMILPRGTGPDILRRLSAAGGSPPPVIVMSEMASQIDLTPYESMVAARLDKPFAPVAVRRCLREVLRGRTEPSAPKNRACASVLLVDDDDELREGLADYLRRTGYQVMATCDAALALALFEQERPDVVVTDWIMPGMSGTELTTRIREMAPEVPVLVLTAFGTPGFVRQALAAGAADVLTKPFTPKALPAALEKCLLRAAQAPAPAEPGQPVPADGTGVSTLAAEERAAILRAIEAAGGNKKLAAHMLGISRAGLYVKLRAYGLK